MRTQLVAMAMAVAAVSLVVPTAANGAVAPALDVPASAGQLSTAVRLNPPKPQRTATQVVFDLVNAERARAGLAPFIADARLDLAAQRHSEDQAAHGTMSHTGSDGSDMGQRIERAGFPWRRAAENVAYGYRTPADVVAGWMNSAGHRTNILSANTHLGVGLAYSADGTPYWTQDFATPS